MRPSIEGKIFNRLIVLLIYFVFRYLICRFCEVLDLRANYRD